jgi:LysR family transcriptional regulator, transcriptional activator of nhaA
MNWLNYHHLLYFWMVAKEGTIARASRELRLAQPTISGQIRQLEAVLKHKLFERKGRNLVLTDVGRIVYRYADEIFSLGRELLGAVEGRTGLPMRLVVGIADVLPKIIVRLLLEPALKLGPSVRVVCREDRSVEEFVAELSVHALDVVLADAPVGISVPVRAFSHLLGECGTTFFASKRLATSLKRRFPYSLRAAPCLLPGAKSTLRRALDQWFYTEDVQPTIVGEFDDSALMHVFGEEGAGFFAGPTVIEEEIRRRFKVQVVGRSTGLRQRFYAISVERKLKHPAVVAISESARRDLFA